MSEWWRTSWKPLELTRGRWFVARSERENGSWGREYAKGADGIPMAMFSSEADAQMWADVLNAPAPSSLPQEGGDSHE